MFQLLLMAEILHQLIGGLSHYLHGFIHLRWCRISAINSMTNPGGFFTNPGGSLPILVVSKIVFLLFEPILRELIQFDDHIFLKWVGSTTN